MRTGIVYWFRDDGTGYIQEGSKRFLVHYSAIKSDDKFKMLVKGQTVKFDTGIILGREIVTSVEVKGIQHE